MRIDIMTILIPSLLIALTGPAVGQQVLTLEQATAKALAQNGEVKAAENDVDAARRGIRQARKLPNPDLELTTESVGASSAGFTVTQPLEFGGKRKARINVANADSLRASIESESKKAAIAAETRRRFYRALGLRQEMDLLDSLAALAESTKTIIEKHVNAGLGSRTELLRSENDVSLLRLERNRVQREYASGVGSLLALWGEHHPAVLPELAGDIDKDIRDTDLPNAKEMIEKSPGIRAAMAEVDAMIAEAKALKAEAFPDMGLSGGYTRDMSESDHVLEFGLSTALPLFNRNTDAADAANLQAEGARRRAEALHGEIHSLVRRHMDGIASFQETARELRNTTIPKATRIYAELQRLYDAGKSSYLELAAAQRELMDVRRELVRNSVEAQSVLADLLELTGQHTLGEEKP